MYKFGHFVICLIIVCSILPVFADDVLETEWIKVEPGASETNLGAKLLRIERTEAMTVLDIELPANKVKDYEEVRVIGKRVKAERPVKQIKKIEWLSDKNENEYGVRFYLDAVPGLEFRLQFYDGDDFKIKP